MVWKVAIADAAGNIYKDATAFKMLHPFPTREAAEEHAEYFRVAGRNCVLVKVE
jgi:hypothetical protein